MLEQNADYLSRGALKQLEDRNKRELNARERSGIMEALASARTLMRDVLLLGLAPKPSRHSIRGCRHLWHA